MDYITVKEAGEKWGVPARAVTYHIIKRCIPGAIKKGNLWLIPASAPQPEDRRYKKNHHSEKGAADKNDYSVEG